MAETTRKEHLAWCKQRALEYLPNNPKTAMFSMLSDMSKHPETKDHCGLMLAPIFYGHAEDEREVRRWVEGFN